MVRLRSATLYPITTPPATPTPPAAIARKRVFIRYTPSDLVVDDTVDVEDEQDGALVAVDEVAHLRIGQVVEDPEGDEVVAVLAEHPAHHGAGRRPFDAQAVVPLVEEHVPAGLQQVVRVVLLRTQEDAVVLRVALPVLAVLREELRIHRRALALGGANTRDGLGLSVVALDLLFNLLDPVAELAVGVLAETLDHALAVLLEGLVDARVRRGQGGVALG